MTSVLTGPFDVKVWRGRFSEMLVADDITLVAC